MTNKVGFAPKDSKIIKDNPGLTPYELKVKGLSQPAFDRLMALPNTDIVPVADPALSDNSAEHSIAPINPNPPGETKAKEATSKKVLTPKVTQLPNEPQGGPTSFSGGPSPLPTQVLVETPAGVRNLLGREFARKLVQQDPRYKIIE